MLPSKTNKTGCSCARFLVPAAARQCLCRCPCAPLRGLRLFPWYFCPCAGKAPAAAFSAPLRGISCSGCRCRCQLRAGKTRTIAAHGVRVCSGFRPFCSCFYRRCRADRVRPGKNNPNNNEFSPLPVPAAPGAAAWFRIACSCPPGSPGTSCPPRIAPGAGAWFTCKEESPLQLRRGY